VVVPQVMVGVFRVDSDAGEFGQRVH
jgi:hypothetical protein